MGIDIALEIFWARMLPCFRFLRIDSAPNTYGLKHFGACFGVVSVWDKGCSLLDDLNWICHPCLIFKNSLWFIVLGLFELQQRYCLAERIALKKVKLNYWWQSIFNSKKDHHKWRSLRRLQWIRLGIVLERKRGARMGAGF